MSKSSEKGFEQRHLTEEEWSQIIRAFSYGKGLLGAKAFRSGNGFIYENDLPGAVGGNTVGLHGIQTAMNAKLGSPGLPFKVFFRHDGREVDSVTLIPKPPRNARLVLFCRKQKQKKQKKSR